MQTVVQPLYCVLVAAQHVGKVTKPNVPFVAVSSELTSAVDKMSLTIAQETSYMTQLGL